MGKASAQPKNDDWKNAEEISIPDKGFGTGTFKGAPSTFKNASIELNESFDQVISSVALHQKSVWYKFTIPTSRSVSIVLRQKDTLIQPLDIGMSVYLSDGFYPDKNDITGYLPSLSQQGSSSQNCLIAGTYYVQVCARSRVKAAIWIELETDGTIAPGNSLEQTYSLIKNSSFSLTTCHSIDSFSERTPFFLSNISRTAYLEFTTPHDLVKTTINWDGSQVGFIIYEGKLKSDLSNKAIFTKAFTEYKRDSIIFRCGSFKSNTTYTIKIYGTEFGSLYVHRPFFITANRAVGSSPFRPVNIGKIDSTTKQKSIYSTTNLSCHNTSADSLCPSLHHLLNDTFWSYSISGDSIKAVQKLSAGYWGTFELESNAKVNLDYYRRGKVFLFKNLAEKDPCELGFPLEVDRYQCLDPGKYTFLIAQNPHYFGKDTIWNANVGYQFGAYVEFIFPKTPFADKIYKYPTYTLAQNLGTVNKNLPFSKTPIQQDWLNAPLTKYIIDQDTIKGHFSFCKFKLDHEAYIQFSGQFEKIWYQKLARVYATYSNTDLKKWSLVEPKYHQKNFYMQQISRQALPAGDYCIVFFRPKRGKCEDLFNHQTNHVLHTLDSLPKPPPTPPTKPCYNQHQWAKSALKINDLKPLNENHLVNGSSTKGLYILKHICTDSTDNLSNPLWVNYMKYRRDLPGFVYYVMRIDKALNVTFDFNTQYQILKGHIGHDSFQTAKKANMLFENVRDKNEICYLKAGYYSIIAATKYPQIDGWILVKPTGYSKNNHARFAQDLGFFSQNADQATATGIISCKTDFDSSHPVLQPSTWHTFRAVGPGSIVLSANQNLGYHIYSTQKGRNLNFKTLVQKKLIDSSVTKGGLEIVNFNEYFDVLQKDTLRYYLVVYNKYDNGIFNDYEIKLRYERDSLATTNGDSCQNAIPINLFGIDSQTVYTNVTVHTMGEAIGEQKPINWHTYGKHPLKSTWFKINVKNGEGNTLTLSQPNHSNLWSMRVLYGNCNALTPGSVLANRNSLVGIDCIANGDYFIQTIEQISLKGDVGINAQVNSSFGLCKLINLNAVIANFDVRGGCDGDSVTFDNYSSQGSDISYQWNFGDGYTSSVIHPKHLYKWSDKLDTFQVQLITSNEVNGAVDTFSRLVVIGKLDFSAGNDTTLCGRLFTTKPRVNYKGVKYEWYWSKQQLEFHDLYSTDRSTEFYSNIDTSTIYLRLSVGNCSAVDSVNLFFPINVHQEKYNIICPGDSFQIKTPASWKASLVTLNQDTVQSIWLRDSGLYNYRVLVDHCDLKVAQRFLKIDEPKLPIVDTFCENNFYKIVFNTKYRWRLYSNSNSVYSIKINNGQYNYPVKWRFNDSICSIDDTLKVNHIRSIPVVMRDTILCDDREYKLGVDNAFGNFKWNTGDTTSSITVKKSGFYSLNYKDSFCSNFQEVLINFYPNIWTEIEDQKFCFDDGSAEVISNFDGHLLWSTGDTTKQITISSAGNYWLKEYDDYCTNTDSFGLTEYCPTVFYMPNAFTPNGDNINPEFIASGVDILKFEMTIYARNGQKVFYSKDMKNGWDGTVLGQEAPLGKYLYIIQFENSDGQQTLSGQFTLIR